MTKVLLAKIKCKCGNEVEMNLYDSVNVTVDPELKEKVINREINIFYCPKCGAKSQDLVYPFLYTDNTKGMWIWCFPEEKKKDREKTEKEVREAREKAEKIFPKNLTVLFAYGYDELEKILNEKAENTTK